MADKKKLISNPTSSNKNSFEYNEGLDNLSLSAKSNADAKDTEFISKSILQQALLTAIRSTMATKDGRNKSSGTEFSELQSTPKRNVSLNESQLEPDPEKFHSGKSSQEKESNPEDNQEFHHRTKWQIICEYMRQFTRSWMMIGILIGMLVWPCSYIYMGLRYLQECNFLSYFPVMFLFMGVSGISVIFSRIIRNISKKYPRFFPRSSCTFCRYVTNLGVFIFAVVFCVELLIFACTPGLPTETQGPQHCNQFFYSFSKSNMWAVLVLGLLLIVLYLPTLCGVRVTRDPILQSESMRERYEARLHSFVRQYGDSDESNES